MTNLVNIYFFDFMGCGNFTTAYFLRDKQSQKDDGTCGMLIESRVTTGEDMSL